MRTDTIWELSNRYKTDRSRLSPRIIFSLLSFSPNAIIILLTILNIIPIYRSSHLDLVATVRDSLQGMTYGSNNEFLFRNTFIYLQGLSQETSSFFNLICVIFFQISRKNLDNVKHRRLATEFILQLFEPKEDNLFGSVKLTPGRYARKHMLFHLFAS